MRRGKALHLGTAALLAALCIAGCASLRDTRTAELAPRSLTDVQEATRGAAHASGPPQVALVLGGGGLRGFAHGGLRCNCRSAAAVRVAASVEARSCQCCQAPLDGA